MTIKILLTEILILCFMFFFVLMNFENTRINENWFWDKGVPWVAISLVLSIFITIFLVIWF